MILPLNVRKTLHALLLYYNINLKEYQSESRHRYKLVARRLQKRKSTHIGFTKQKTP